MGYILNILKYFKNIKLFTIKKFALVVTPEGWYTMKQGHMRGFWADCRFLPSLDGGHLGIGFLVT